MLHKPLSNHSGHGSEREQQLQMSPELSGKSLLNQKILKTHGQHLLDRKRKAATSPSIGMYMYIHMCACVYVCVCVCTTYAHMYIIFIYAKLTIQFYH